MDFDEAIEAHKAWKARLLTYIEKPDGSLTNHVVTDDTACDLGKWIYGDAATAYGSDQDYLKLRAYHASFHMAAAGIIRQVDRSEMTSVEVLVGSRSVYAIASDAVVECILRIKEKHP